MKVYKLSFDYNYSVADIVGESEDADFMELSSETPDLLNKFRFDWGQDESIIKPNLAIIVAELFCCDYKAFESLRPLIDYVELSAIIIGQDKFFSLSNVPVMEKAINIKSSKVKYFSTGDIMEISKPVFNAGDYPALFKTDDMGGTFFCTQELKEAVESNHLTGLLFTECKVKSKSWFG